MPPRSLVTSRFLSASVLLAALACGPRDRAQTQIPDHSGAAAQVESRALVIDEPRMFADLEHLASDELQGRFTLAPELEQAAEYIIKRYKDAGISPVERDYLHRFPLITGAKAVGEQTLAIGRAGKEKPVAEAAFTPVALSGSGSVEGPVVFVGYGATGKEKIKDDGEGDANAPTATPEAKVIYDDLAGVDVKGKIALVLLDGPGSPDLRSFFAAIQDLAEKFEQDAKPLREKKDTEAMTKLHRDIRKEIGDMISPFLRGQSLPKTYYDAPENPLEDEFNLMKVLRPLIEISQDLPGPEFDRSASSLRAKVDRLAEAGAIGVVAVRGPRSYVTKKDRQEAVLADLENAGISDGDTASIPVVQLSWKDADKLVRIKGKKLSALQKKIDEALTPHSGDAKLSAKIAVNVEPVTKQVPNIVGMIPGSDLAHEVILIGAHYDHIGNTETGRCSAAKTGEHKDVICNGADDNASGSVMILEFARAFKDAGITPRRSLVFAHFAGEELGLYGSAAMAKNPPLIGPLKDAKIVAMLNLDMVGRLGPKGLAVGGISSSDQWMPMLDEIGNHGMKILYERSISARSDQANFYKNKIPVLFFFTNVHGDYHRATDHIEKIDRDGMKRIGELAGELLLKLADGAPIDYAEPRTPAEGLGGGLPGDNPKTVEKKVKSDGSPG